MGSMSGVRDKRCKVENYNFLWGQKITAFYATGSFACIIMGILVFVPSEDF